ncbi:hypothetical protein ACMWFL_27660, partial [Klebsiella pneumoniae]
KNSLNRLIRCVCGKKIGPDPRNFNQRVSLGRNDLLIRTFLSATAPEEMIFHIISNDKGYDGVIAELCRAGRRCCRISSPCSAEKPKAAPMVISNDEVLHLTDKVQSLSKKSAGNRPANTSSLMNYIKSLSGNTKGMALYGRVKEELIRRGVIAVYEKTVVWR